MTKLLPLSRWGKNEQPERKEYSDDESDSEEDSGEEIIPPLKPKPVLPKSKIKKLQKIPKKRLLKNAANPKAKKAKLQSKPKPKRKKKQKKRLLLPSTIPSRS